MLRSALHQPTSVRKHIVPGGTVTPPSEPVGKITQYFGRKPWSYVALSALCSILLPSEWKPNDKVKKGISSIYGMGEVFMMQERVRAPRLGQGQGEGDVVTLV